VAPSNPKASKWHSPSQALRKRKQVMFTLSEEARARLDELAGPSGNRSAIVERAITLVWQIEKGGGAR
jgi:hypothetical protein